ncbi:KOW domain-containing protein [Peptostreptococcus russellii]|uniref:KOW domain-containing RNA-binding protein n=1 Tax=Peptostreptococcus russellii TaxID=215200 RepID=UPI00162AAD70|nr:KOW domain-containing RNA-binding protein [Peptostreptococcus russellii]MBC2578420.1 KOW domain-containing protein [Peptostreptococcus russellii]
MLSENLSVGQLVKASCGRDQGKLFFIVRIVDEDYVMISDGKSRKLDKPKLKKIKHLNIHKFVDVKIKELLLNGDNITDSLIRAEIDKLK